MSLLESLYTELKTAILEKDNNTKAVLRIILGETGRQAKKDLSNDEIIKIIKKLISSAEECCNYSNDPANSIKDNPYIEKLKSYVPEDASEEEIINWIKTNIDFTNFKNKMQAMKPIMSQFSNRVDGNKVKKILEEL